ncbi:MAG: SH3 domain-containing protein [Promethearchaeota archaeon]
MKKKVCQVIEDYHSAYPDPFIVNKGEILRIENKECEWPGWIWCVKNDGEGRWVPINHIELEETQAKFIKDYNSLELSVSTGQILTIEKESYGWIWVIDENNKTGWIPLKNVKILNK